MGRASRLLATMPSQYNNTEGAPKWPKAYSGLSLGNRKNKNKLIVLPHLMPILNQKFNNLHCCFSKYGRHSHILNYCTDEEKVISKRQSTL